jgi:putative transcriptional regulator
MTLGDKLRNFRKRSGLSQLELEAEVGASSGTISRIENDEVNPTKETVLNIATALHLNDREVSYLIGTLASPANNQEINQARLEIKKYFNKKNVLAYLIDDRCRFLDISRGFSLLMGLSEERKESLVGKTMAQIILDDSFGLKKYISKNKYQEVMHDAFLRNYCDMYFMKGDEIYEEMMIHINKDQYIKTLWENFEKSGTVDVPVSDTRKVFFNYLEREIAMIYSNEPLPKYPRFRVLDYQPASFLLRILSKFQ